MKRTSSRTPSTDKSRPPRAPGRRPAAPGAARRGKGFGARLAEALRRQHRLCELYRRLCEARGWKPPARIATPQDLGRVPFLPAHAFKRSLGLYARLVNGAPEAVRAWTASSGTSGDPSLVGRNDEDLLKARRLLVEVGRHFGHLTRDMALMFFRDPAELRREAGMLDGRPVEPFLAHLMEEFGAARERRFLLPGAEQERGRPGALLPQVAGEFGAAVRQACVRGQSVFIGGLAPVLAPCLEALEAAGFRWTLPPGGILMLAGGGWDGRKGSLAAPAPIRKEVLLDCTGRLLGLRRRQVVDLYGFTESPAWFAGHYSPEDGDFLYHSPAWARVVLRDPLTLDPVAEPEQPGLLEVLTWRGVDSYPGAAILVDDVAAWSGRPACPVCRGQGPLFRILGTAAGEQASRCAALARELAVL